jgi:hypothetical protein
MKEKGSWKALFVSIDPIPPDPLPQKGKGEEVPPYLGRDLGWGQKKQTDFPDKRF